MRPILITLSLLALGGCATAPAEAEGVAPDSCGAQQYQWLVGKNKSAIPTKPAGATWRLHADTDPVTMDYSDARMNVVWSSKTEVITEVKCG